MLIVISDLHLVDGTAGEHNVPAGAFNNVFMADIVALAKDRDAKEIKLLLLGDIVDLIRSEQWLSDGSKLVPLKDRPWGSGGLRDVSQYAKGPKGTPTAKRCLKILGRYPSSGKKPTTKQTTILYKNWDTFKFFREFGSIVRRELKIPDLLVEVIYVPGNHDRMVNVYPEVRDQLQKMLGLTVNDETTVSDGHGNWWYRYDYTNEKYWVYARHGHQYDEWNYAGGIDHRVPAQLTVSIGDVITTEFAVKLPWQVQRLGRKNTAVTDTLVKSLKEMDNVRPLSRIIEWFYYRIQQENRRKVHKALEDAFETVVKDLLKIPFVQQWRSPTTRVDDIVRLLSHRWFRWIPRTLVDRLDAEDLLPFLLGKTGADGDPGEDPYAQAAHRETIWRKNPNVRYILYGHTHRPLQVPLERIGGRDIIYINTGTWRERIYRTVRADRHPDFVQVKQMTFAIFYHAKEDLGTKHKDAVSFDIWTGTRKK